MNYEVRLTSFGFQAIKATLLGVSIKPNLLRVNGVPIFKLYINKVQSSAQVTNRVLGSFIVI